MGGTGTVCSLLSGGNIDLTMLIPVMRHGLSLAGRYPRDPQPPDRSAGRADQAAPHVGEQRANIVAIEHRREGIALQVADVGIDITLITRNEEHCLAVIAGIEADGFAVERLR